MKNPHPKLLTPCVFGFLITQCTFSHIDVFHKLLKADTDYRLSASLTNSSCSIISRQIKVVKIWLLCDGFMGLPHEGFHKGWLTYNITQYNALWQQFKASALSQADIQYSYVQTLHYMYIPLVKDAKKNILAWVSIPIPHTLWLLKLKNTLSLSQIKIELSLDI